MAFVQRQTSTTFAIWTMANTFEISISAGSISTSDPDWQTTYANVNIFTLSNTQPWSGIADRSISSCHTLSKLAWFTLTNVRFISSSPSSLSPIISFEPSLCAKTPSSTAMSCKWWKTCTTLSRSHALQSCPSSLRLTTFRQTSWKWRDIQQVLLRLFKITKVKRWKSIRNPSII